MDEIEGLPGELIDRLIEVLNNDALGDRSWYDVGIRAHSFVGGSAARTFPDTGEEPAPGTVGELVRRGRQLVSRDEWFEHLQGRLTELVMSGMSELFLVRSIRDEVRRALADAGNLGEADQNRADMRERIEHLLDHPADLASYRADLAERDPSVAALSDEEFSTRLRGMLEFSGFSPVSAEEAVDRWGTLNNWDGQVALLLSDSVLGDWQDRATDREWRSFRRN